MLGKYLCVLALASASGFSGVNAFQFQLKQEVEAYDLVWPRDTLVTNGGLASFSTAVKFTKKYPAKEKSKMTEDFMAETKKLIKIDELNNFFDQIVEDNKIEPNEAEDLKLISSFLEISAVSSKIKNETAPLPVEENAKKVMNALLTDPQDSVSVELRMVLYTFNVKDFTLKSGIIIENQVLKAKPAPAKKWATVETRHGFINSNGVNRTGNGTGAKTFGSGVAGNYKK